MLEIFSDNEKKLNLALACMNQIPKLRPDNKTPAWVKQMIDASTQVRSDYLAKDAALKTGRGQLHRAWDLGHQAAISVYPIMQSLYRNDPVASEGISKLPVSDDTAPLTLTRMESISKQWEELPNMPETNKEFVAGDIDKESFDDLTAKLREKLKALGACEVQFKAATGELNKQDDANASFIAATLKQGRGQFSEGTAERKLIEAIQTASASTPDTTPAATTPATADATPKAAPSGVPQPEASPSAPTPVNFVEPPTAVNQ
jgi:hypothetical protein